MKPPLRIDGTQREDNDSVLYQKLVRDVCFLYHELSDYRHIMGDLDYAGYFPLQYWELLNRVDTGSPEDRFIRGGILILMLAMLEDVFDGSGDSISQHHLNATEALARFVPEDDNMLRLANAVEHGLHLLTTTCCRDDQYAADICWAYDIFVRGYFADAAS